MINKLKNNKKTKKYRAGSKGKANISKRIKDKKTTLKNEETPECSICFNPILPGESNFCSSLKGGKEKKRETILTTPDNNNNNNMTNQQMMNIFDSLFIFRNVHPYGLRLRYNYNNPDLDPNQLTQVLHFYALFIARRLNDTNTSEDMRNRLRLIRDRQIPEQDEDGRTLNDAARNVLGVFRTGLSSVFDIDDDINNSRNSRGGKNKKGGKEKKSKTKKRHLKNKQKKTRRSKK